MRRAIFLGSTALFTAAIGLASPAMAADAPAASEEETSSGDIIVTARKRDERLIDVPISVQAFSEIEIRKSGIDDLQTLKDRAGFQVPPQVSNGTAGRFFGNLIFRGLQANSFGDPRDSSGALFVDGVYVSGGIQSVGTADVARIEVLKGPQNAYFGRSTFGGAVNFITSNPSKDFGVQANMRLTGRGTFDGDLSVEGTVIPEVLTARITAAGRNKVAQYRAADGGKLGAEESLSFTSTLYFTPTDNFWIRLRGTYQEDNDSAPSFAFISANAQAQGCIGQTVPGFRQLTGGPVTLAREYFCKTGVPDLKDVLGFVTPLTTAGATTLVGSNVISSNTVLPSYILDVMRTGLLTSGAPALFFAGLPELTHAGLRRDSVRLSGQSGYTFDSGATLSFNAGYNKQDSIAFNDIDKTNVLRGFAGIVGYRSKDLTLDARFTTDPSKSLRLLVGASYFKGTLQISQADTSAFTAPNTVVQGLITNERASVPAVYASVDFDLLPNLTLTAEGRYQEDKVTNFNASGTRFSQKFADFLPRGIISFKPTKNMNIYASYSRGVQPARLQGGFIGLAALPFATQATAYVQSIFPGIGPFTQIPKLDAYELGIKQSLMDNRLTYTIAVYQNDWSNALVTSAIFNPVSCFPVGAAAIANTAACPLGAGGTSNALPNDARVRGVELAVDAQVSDFFSVAATVDYKNAKWKNYANSGFNGFVGLVTPDVYRGDGNKLGRVPAWSGTLSPTFKGRISDAWGYYVRGDAIYTGKAFDSDINIFKTDAYIRVNLRVGVERDNFTIEAFAMNLLNDKTFDAVANTVELAGNFTQRAAAVIPAQKREFGLRARIKL